MGPSRTRDLWLGGRVYWLCQLAGWGGYAAEGIVSDLLWDRWSSDTVAGTLCIAGSGLLVSHGWRAALRTLRWAERPLRQLPGWTALAAASMAVGWMALTEAVRRAAGTLDAGGLTPWMWAMIWLYALLLAGGWNAFYFATHAAQRLLTAQKEAQVERWRLQAALAEAQFHALKAQVHPHFLFNALNSLRALVDENPARAREAITRLSNLLRYSLQAGTVAAVPLARELEVVDDYLGLEGIRLESRLRVRRRVAAAALAHPVPPLSVQTLVENAVKYGVTPFRAPQEITLAVSLDVAGGLLRVEVGNGCAPPHEAPPVTASSGVGLRNLGERLRRFAGERASVRLDRLAGERVRVEMIIPLAENAGPRRPEPLAPPAARAAQAIP